MAWGRFRWPCISTASRGVRYWAVTTHKLPLSADGLPVPNISCGQWLLPDPPCRQRQDQVHRGNQRGLWEHRGLLQVVTRGLCTRHPYCVPVLCGRGWSSHDLRDSPWVAAPRGRVLVTWTHAKACGLRFLKTAPWPPPHRHGSLLSLWSGLRRQGSPAPRCVTPVAKPPDLVNTAFSPSLHLPMSPGRPLVPIKGTPVSSGAPLCAEEAGATQETLQIEWWDDSHSWCQTA